MPFGAKMFRNKVTFGAMATSVTLALLCVYIPGLNSVLSARPFPGEVYGVALGGTVAVVCVEVRSRVIITVPWFIVSFDVVLMCRGAFHDSCLASLAISDDANCDNGSTGDL